jgi:hypothetical protein
MAGVLMGYYDFFPVEKDENKAEYGRVPTWGTCTVVESRCDFVPKGQRVYGMVPVSSSFVATPKAARNAWIDSAAHRQKRDIVYNTYVILDKDPLYPGPKYEEPMILVRPLFVTAWLLREAVLMLPCETLVITSASSKTGASLACLAKAAQSVNRNLRIIGMTSLINVDYCQSLGYFDEVLEYDKIKAVPKNNVVVVDMAGNLNVLKKLQLELKTNLLKMISIGMTHVGDSDMKATFSGEGFDPKYAKPEFFFAPHYVNVVSKKDPHALTERMPKDWLEFIQSYPLSISHCEDIHKVEKVLQDFVNGRVPGSISWVGSLKGDGGRASL